MGPAFDQEDDHPVERRELHQANKIGGATPSRLKPVNLIEESYKFLFPERPSYDEKGSRLTNEKVEKIKQVNGTRTFLRGRLQSQSWEESWTS